MLVVHHFRRDLVGNVSFQGSPGPTETESPFFQCPQVVGAVYDLRSPGLGKVDLGKKTILLNKEGTVCAALSWT